VAEVRDAARRAVVLGGVGVVLDVNRLEDKRLRLDDFGGWHIAHKAVSRE
jgi:hypothetical protein